jgi:hypothetical protein
MKEAIGLVAAVLVFAAYIPYIRDILRGKTQPHVYSWFLWGVLTIVIFGIQITHHAGAGSFVTIAAGTMSLVVLALSLKNGKRDIVFSDRVVFVLTILTMVFWLLAKQPLLAILLACLADLLAFIPTVRKSWNKPFTETLSLYQLNALRFGLAVIALEQYTFINLVWPAMWTLGNGLFALMLVARRKQVR